jgi:hypothetical protein
MVRVTLSKRPLGSQYNESDLQLPTSMPKTVYLWKNTFLEKQLAPRGSYLKVLLLNGKLFKLLTER